jgi:4-hydroxybenzoate polyprenyltransferase
MKSTHFLSRFGDLFFSMRPILLVPVWGFSIFGYFRAKSLSLMEIPHLWNTIPGEVYFSFLIFSLSVGVVYIFNQLADIEVDKKNGGLPLIASGVVTVKEAWLFAGILSFLSVVVPLLFHQVWLSFFALASIITGTLYSFKPFFFSGKIIFDFLSNAFGYGCIAFGVGWGVGGKDLLTMEFMVASLPYFLLMCCGSINSTLPDIAGDKAEGKLTTAVVLGVRNAHILSTCLLIGAAVVSIITNDVLAMGCSLLSLPIYIVYLFFPSRTLMEATYKIGGALCMLCAFIIMPLVLLISCCLFYLTRTYFKVRHKVSYPSMVPSQYEK